MLLRVPGDGNVKRVHDLGSVWHEPVVKIDHPQETAQIFRCGRGRVVVDGGHFRWEMNHAGLCDGVGQELDLCLPELALVRIHDQVVGGESAEEFAEVFGVSNGSALTPDQKAACSSHVRVTNEAGLKHKDVRDIEGYKSKKQKDL